MKNIAILVLMGFLAFGLRAQVSEKPFVLGQVLEMDSEQMNEKRQLNIYLPEGYHSDDSSRYSVIYLLDGSADEDFIHVAGLVQFANFPWVDMLPKSIVVGISNVDRRRDFTFPTTIEKDKADFPTTGSSQNFIAFIEKELQPLIDKKYRTNAHKMLIGQSLGGLLATEILFQKPQLFNQYLIVSPSLWWDKQSLFNRMPDAFASPVHIYVGVGKEGKVMQQDAQRLARELKKKKNASVHFEFFGKENHANILHQAVYRAFQHF